MRLGWRIPLPGPFTLGGTIWRSRSHRVRSYYGKLPGWTCEHAHRTPSAAQACAQREARRRAD